MGRRGKKTSTKAQEDATKVASKLVPNAVLAESEAPAMTSPEIAVPAETDVSGLPCTTPMTRLTAHLAAESAAMAPAESEAVASPEITAVAPVDAEPAPGSRHAVPKSQLTRPQPATDTESAPEMVATEPATEPTETVAPEVESPSSPKLPSVPVPAETTSVADTKTETTASAKEGEVFDFTNVWRDAADESAAPSLLVTPHESAAPSPLVTPREVVTKSENSKWKAVDTSYIDHRTKDVNMRAVRRKSIGAEDAGEFVSNSTSKESDGKWKAVETSYIDHRTKDVNRRASRRSMTPLDGAALADAGQLTSASISKESDGKWKVDVSYIGHRTTDTDNLDKKYDKENAPVYADPAETKFSYEKLKDMVDEVDPKEKQAYLTDTEFQAVFDMDRPAFIKLPRWKQQTLKKAKELF